jgi:hypothetical protein
MPEYRILPGTPQEEFGTLRTMVQVFGGGYGNGKTAASVVQKVLAVARDYPGANILVARSTYPKLNDTIRKEFLKWCPPSWIASFPRSKNSDNTCTLKNGTMINFRYIAQQGKSVGEGEQTTSNLLSATYVLIVVDQMEDPEITEKDFDDLIGRLRGSAKYIGSDPTMPLTGPRWFCICVNPTRNWVYRRLIAPLQKYKHLGVVDDALLVKRQPRDINGVPNPDADKPILDENGKPKLLISLVEGSTYTNSHNLDPSFIEGLEAVYRGQSRDRFLYGEWAAYEGLVHPDFGEATHCISRKEMYEYLDDMMSKGIQPRFIEGYDFGISEPSCYMIAFTDRYKNVFIIDGFYTPELEMHIDQQQKFIMDSRMNYGCDESNLVQADPDIFRRKGALKSASSKTIAQLFAEGDNAIAMIRADNSIESGITKINSYLTIKDYHRHPIFGHLGAPNLYIATELTFVIGEITSYYWKQDPNGQRTDVPIDKNDHSMNTLKYMLAREPELAVRTPKERSRAYLTTWMESEQRSTNARAHRHG